MTDDSDLLDGFAWTPSPSGPQTPSFERIFDSFPGAVLVLLPDSPVFTIVAVNQAYLQAANRTRREFIGHGMFEVFSRNAKAVQAETLENIRRSFETVLQTRQADIMPVQRFNPRDPESPGGGEGERFWNARNIPALRPDGSVEFIFRLVRDVTQKITAEAELERSRSQQNLLWRLMVDQRKMSDPLKIMLASSEAVANFLKADCAGFFEVGGDSIGFCAEWTDGKLPRQTGSISQEAFGVELRKAACAGLTVAIENTTASPLTAHSAFPPAGALALINVPITRNQAWQAGFYVHHAQPRQWTEDEISFVRDFGEQAWDAVERARAEIASRKSEESLSFALEAGGGVGAWDWNIRTDEVTCNARFAQLFSVDPVHNTSGVRFSEFLNRIHPEDTAWVTAKITLARDRGTDFSEEFRIVQPGGSLVWILARGRCHLDEHGLPARFPGVVFDVTARHNAEHKLLQMAKMESLGVLAGGVAHDFNNLLTGILANASMLLDDLPEDLRHFADDVISASETAAQLTRQMLAYAGRGQFHSAPIDLSEQVRGIVPLIRPGLRQSAVRLNLAAGLPEILGDEGQIRQLIMNLIINAAEAMESSPGEVLIETGTLDVDEAYMGQSATFQSFQPGPHVWLEVHDSGVGMSEETQARIFDPFFTTKVTGRGLGLAAVLGIVRGHKGALRVYSVLGRGTTFKVLFPASALSETVLAPVMESESPKRKHAHILFVDDEEVIRRVGAHCLERLGYSVAAAADGQEALDLFAADPQRFSLVVLDLTMPKMSGEEAFSRLRQIRSDIPIIVSSGYNQMEVIRRFTVYHAAEFVQKPYTAKQLSEKVISALASRDSR